MLVLAVFALHANAQSVPYARTYAKTKDEVDQTLKELQAYAGQKLPIVEGFVATGDKPLDRFERAFYQFSIDLLPASTSGTVVRVTAKITAWYADKDPAKSGYQVLPSNGRLELDLLDRLDEKFGNKPPSSASSGLHSEISAPKPKLDLGVRLPSNPTNAPPPSRTAPPDELAALRTKREAEERHMKDLSDELSELEAIRKSQAHPLNLVSVRRSGTPVLAKPSEGAALLFNAAANDEFEFLDAAGEWVHVQISGASRGYIRKSNLELPDFVAEKLRSENHAADGKTSTFRIVREEISTFPGSWEPLRGKSAKIYTVQPVSQDSKETGARAKLSFVTSIFQNYVADAASSLAAVDGVVVIFDSADGGIAAATLAGIKQLASGTQTAQNFWAQAYLDPPEAFQESPKH